MEVERECTIVLDFNGRSLLFANNMIMHNDFDNIVQLLYYFRIVHYHMTLDDNFATMHAVFTPVSTRVVQQLWHLFLFHFLLCLHTDWDKNQSKENRNNGFLHFHFRCFLCRGRVPSQIHLQRYYNFPIPPNFDPRSVQISVKKLPYSC